MVFIKKVINADTGTADLWGGNDNDRLDDFHDNVDITPAVAKINTRTYFRSGKFEIRNPADTFSYVFIASALAANRNITLPLLTSNDIPTFNSFAATLSNKTLDATCDVTAATGGSVTDAQYVTLATHAGLSAERTLAVGDGLTLTDAGANGAATINTDILDRARRRVSWIEDFFGYADIAGSNTMGNGIFVASVSGTAASVDDLGVTDTGVFGVWYLSTGSTTTGSSGIRAGSLSSFSLGQGTATIECYVKIPTLSTVGEEFIFRIGFSDSVTDLGVDGVHFEYDRLNSVNWRIRCRSNSVSTLTSTSTAVGTGWTRLKIVVNAAGTSAEFFIAGSSVGTTATNIPVGSGRELTVIAMIIKSAGSTSRTVRLDYIALDMDLTTPR